MPRGCDDSLKTPARTSRARGLALCALRSSTLRLCAIFLAACGGASDAVKNETFYDWSLGDGTRAFEARHPSLDWPKGAEAPGFIGVSVLGGGVRLSRPSDWRLRNASSRPGEPFIHYVSPRAYSFAIYQRRDPPSDDWREILGRYEADVAAVGARVIGGRVPMATYWGQGRAYSVERDVSAAKAPLRSRSREMVLRSERRVVLVQIVYQDENLSEVDDELVRALATLEVR